MFSLKIFYNFKVISQCLCTDLCFRGKFRDINDP